jgi:outer membrane murein-binding lipoprotein Lpp
MAAKKPDPISDKARSLEAEIAALESEIKKLDSQLQRPAGPKFRSTATAAGTTMARPPEKPAPSPPAPKVEPVFEELKSSPLSATGAAEAPDLYNELGVRKYDLPALWNRLRNHFSGPSTGNPRLVNYLAAGGVHGLRPLRYEKRVARNRFIVLAAILFLILFGTLLVYLQHR